jgi:hypothetical protein
VVKSLARNVSHFHVMKIDDFFAELKRRNVHKVAVAYIVAGWADLRGQPRFEALAQRILAQNK